MQARYKVCLEQDQGSCGAQHTSVTMSCSDLCEYSHTVLGATDKSTAAHTSDKTSIQYVKARDRPQASSNNSKQQYGKILILSLFRIVWDNTVIDRHKLKQ